jgi:hypothetical protein
MSDKELVLTAKKSQLLDLIVELYTKITELDEKLKALKQKESYEDKS